MDIRLGLLKHSIASLSVGDVKSALCLGRSTNGMHLFRFYTLMLCYLIYIFMLHYAMEKVINLTDVIVVCVANERACLSRVRTNSCQSDSSGFLEEPFVPAYPNPGHELMKVRLATANTFGGKKEMCSIFA